MTSLAFAVVGDPIAHSRSPEIHEAALRWNGIDGSYERRKAGQSEVAGIVEEVRSGQLHGVNVTMPNKSVAAGLADALTDHARRARAVNTLWCSDGIVYGDTTDVEGIRWAWAKGALPGESPVMILGAGGAAAAAALAFEEHDLVISARNQHRASELLEETGVAGRVVAWGESVPGAAIVNATPIGMKPNVRESPLDADLLENTRVVMDAVYNPINTRLLSDALMADCQTIPGLDMLLYQAMAAVDVWLGEKQDWADINLAEIRELTHNKITGFKRKAV